MESLAGRGIVVVLDFDRTIIEPDSDDWVVEELGVTAAFSQLLATMPWNSLMDRMMKEVHEQGKSTEDIKEALRRVAIHPKIVSAIKYAYSRGCDLRIVSDANTVFIETILEHVGIKECFSEIHTNPAYIDREDRLHICPYVDFDSCPHGCNLCPPNMCKGRIIERIQASMMKEGKGTVIYLGDGKGDFCPSLKLKVGDFMMPRKGFPVWDLISQNRELVHAQVHEWTDGEELNSTLLRLIDETMSKNSSSIQLLPAAADCMLGTAATAVPDALPLPALKVGH
ncbi:inorganic pyrophosphatase 2-like [Andrographis paniculata]|uniref:inorganic pyrophosphatase 2-like n=1 Tax=Andrographis paniculata TaxID=175694 RepID=UPI0021E7231D|nr:inorganic pyrophosphatase 2-like [Andrographis paniculata]